MPAANDVSPSVDQAIVLLNRHQLTGEPADLERAESLLRPVVDDGRRHRAPRVDAMLALCDVLVLRGWEGAVPEILDEAVRLAGEAADLVPAGDRIWPLAQAHLSWALSKRFELGRRMPDLEAAVRHAANAVSRVRPDDENLGLILIKSWYTYQFSFDRTGRLADLDEAVRIARLAVLKGDLGEARDGKGFLAGSLMIRFTVTGNAADIEEAVRLGRQVLTELPAGHIDRGSVAGNLALALTNRHLRGDGPVADLREAAELSREVMAELPKYPYQRSMLLANHAVLLFGQETIEGSPTRLAEAIQFARAALEAVRGDQRARQQATLANLILLQARRGKDPAGVSAAIEIGRTALAELSPGNPERVRALNMLATALNIRHRITGDPADLDAAVGMWRSAVGSPVGPIINRMAAARAWAEAAASRDDATLALEAYTAGVDLLPLLAWRGLDRAVQEKRLAAVTGLAGDAAAWALTAGQPERAVELLEQGRQVLWAQAVQTRSDLSALAAVAPELAAGLDEIRRELDGGTAPATLPLPRGLRHDPVLELELQTMTAGGAPPGEAGRRRRLAERWEHLLADARRQPGFAGFLTSPTFATLRRAAAGGPVVLVNTSKWRSDALIVTTDGVHQVPLPWLEHELASARANALLTAQREVEQGRIRADMAQAALRQTLRTTLRWLWDTVAEPVLAVLADLVGTDRPRVWWCPTGPLTMLPLHAAGRWGGAPTDRRRLTVPANCVPSYTASLGALMRARSGPPPRRPPRVFAVGAGQLPGQPALPAVSDELQAVTTSLSGVRLLAGSGATTGAVLAALGRHEWAHFACHAEQDFDRPSASSLRLADGRLSVLELASALGGADRQADLAYLSACRTAAGARALPDEAIHLTAALQFGGFRHVIGSQWAVADRIAAQVAGDVYAHLATGGGPDADGAAHALDRALARVRRENPDRPDLWAALIHTGP
jgi:CHAT domain-containing protein